MASRFTFTKGTAQYRNYRIGIWALVVAVFLLIGFAFVDVGSISIGSNKYNLSLIRLNKAIAYGVAILGLQVVIGYTGQIALGQSFFFGMGAYISAWLVADHSWPFLLTLLMVVPSCFLVGMLCGLPALRIKGLYLALLTFGLAALFPTLIKLDSLYDYTGGANGKLTSYKLKRRLGYRLMKSLRHFKLSRFSVLFLEMAHYQIAKNHVYGNIFCSLLSLGFASG